jgi:hypothetical protein
MSRKLLFDAFILVFLALFIVLWAIIAIRILTFTPSDTAPILTFGPFTIEIATLVGATLATAAASALGFEVPNAIREYEGMSTERKAEAGKLRAVVDKIGWPLVAAVLGYSLVGLVMILIVALKPDYAPQFVLALALSWVGWIAGVFVASIKGPTS